MTQRPDRFAGRLHTPPAAADTQPIDLAAILATLWRGRLHIAAVAVAALLLAAIFAWQIATPRYRATAVVMLESRQAEVVGLDSVLGGLSGETPVINTEAEVLRGRGLIGQVVDRLALTDDAEFNAALRPAGGLATALRGVLGGGAAPAPGAARQRDATVSALLERLRVRNLPMSLVFQITVETTDPEKSARIADTIAQTYIEDQLRVKFAATEEATAWLSARVGELQADLETAEAAARAFRGRTDLIDAQTLAALEGQLKDTRERQTATTARALALANRAALLAAAQGRAAQAAAAGDALMTRLAAEAETSAAAATEFDGRLGALITQTAAEHARTEAQAFSLATAITELDAQIVRQSRELIELNRLSREADASRLIHEHFQARLKETAVQQGIHKADSRILSLAVAPEAPSAPRKTLILALAAVVGVIAGVALVLLREARASGLRSVRDLEALTGRTVLGQVPLIPEPGRARALAWLAEHPTSAAAEAVRNLRTSILLSDIDSTPQVIVLSSSVPAEGKTTLTLALAQNLTAMGKRVLVVEGDIRRRVFGQYFRIRGDLGLIAVLSGAARLADAVHTEAGLGDILIGEPTKTNAADLFSSDAFGAFIRDARTVYDVVLIDTPPVLVVPDARVIGQLADAIVFVVQWDKTSRGQVEEALRMFDTVNLRVAGLVLTQVSPEGMRRYGHGDRYGAYAAYGNAYYAPEYRP